MRCNRDKAPATNEKHSQYAKQSRVKAIHEKHSYKAKPAQKPNFLCDVCLKSFIRNSSMNHYKQVLHAGIQQHVCHICSRTFGKADSLDTHLVLHIGKKYRCKLCHKSFAKSSFLRKHLEEHELPDSKRKYTCVVCSKKFTTISHLNDHGLIHSNKKPHSSN